jgi:endonuclease-3
MAQQAQGAPLDADTLAYKQRRYRDIATILEATYGFPEWRPFLPPVDELVSTILSQSTSDTNRDKGFDALKARYESWEEVRDAPLGDIVATIRPAGLANQKAPRIQEALRTITQDDGRITLDFLNDLSVPEAKAWLTGLHGIGPKTAAIILLFAFGRPAFPVDTHVHRVTGRLGLIGPKISADQAHVILEAIIPPEEYFPAHLNIIQHGRQICHARGPECERCPLTMHCDYFLARDQLE